MTELLFFAVQRVVIRCLQRLGSNNTIMSFFYVILEKTQGAKDARFVCNRCNPFLLRREGGYLIMTYKNLIFGRIGVSVWED